MSEKMTTESKMMFLFVLFVQELNLQRYLFYKDTFCSSICLIICKPASVQTKALSLTVEDGCGVNRRERSSGEQEVTEGQIEGENGKKRVSVGV